MMTEEELNGWADRATGAPPASTGTATPPSGDASFISQQEYEDLERRHGGRAGVTNVSPKEKDVFGREAPTRNPIYRYTFRDGTYLTMQAVGDGYNVVGTSTALRSSASSNPIYREGEDGRIYLIDPDTNKATPVEGIPGKQPAPVSEQIVTSPPATQADIVVRDATGALVKRPNPLYDQAAAQQAEADRQRTIGAQQQSQQLAAQREALDQARFAWQKEQDAIRNQLANDRLSFDQARAAADEAHSRYTAQVSKLNLDVAQRGQDISMRNQEIDTAERLGAEASRAATASLPYLAPKGSTENISKAIGSLGSGGYKPVQYGAVPTAAFPFDPTNVGLDVTKQVLTGFMTGAGGFQAPARPEPVNTAVQLPEPVFTAPG